MTDQPLEPSLLDAIDQGRGQRGGRSPQTWSRRRAQVLTLTHQGLSHIRIGGEVGLSRKQMSTLLKEACEAVLRGGAVSDAADRVCEDRWRGWCEIGDTAACDRLQPHDHG